MALTSALEIRVKQWFDTITASGYTKYYSFADDFKTYPLLACESADQQNYVELSEGTTTLTGYNIVFAIADKVSRSNIPASLTRTINRDIAIIFTSVVAGDAGNLLSIKFEAAPALESFSVLVSGSDYIVKYENTTTYKNVMDYFNLNFNTIFSVTAGLATIVTSMTKINLSGGVTNGEIFTKDKLQKQWEDIFETRSSGIKGVILAKEYTRTVRDNDNIMHLYAAIKITKG